MRQKMRVQCNKRGISIFIVIAVGLTGMIIPAMTQPAFPLFRDAGNATDGETENAPVKSPILPLPSLAPTLTLMSSYPPGFYVALKQSTHTTNYTIHTGSYPQINHEQNFVR